MALGWNFQEKSTERFKISFYTPKRGLPFQKIPDAALRTGFPTVSFIRR